MDQVIFIWVILVHVLSMVGALGLCNLDYVLIKEENSWVESTPRVPSTINIKSENDQQPKSVN